MLEWILQNKHFLEFASYLVAFNVALSGVHKALKMIEDKTTSNVDNKAAAMIGKLSGWISYALDFVGFNPAHKK